MQPTGWRDITAHNPRAWSSGSTLREARERRGRPSSGIGSQTAVLAMCPWWCYGWLSVHTHPATELRIDGLRLPAGVVALVAYRLSEKGLVAVTAFPPLVVKVKVPFAVS